MAFAASPHVASSSTVSIAGCGSDWANTGSWRPWTSVGSPVLCSSKGTGGAAASITPCSTARSSAGPITWAPSKAIDATRTGAPSSMSKPSAASPPPRRTSEVVTRTSWYPRNR